MSTVPGPAPPVLTTIGRAGEAGVAHIVLNRPQAPNAITVALAAGLSGALRAGAAAGISRFTGRGRITGESS